MNITVQAIGFVQGGRQEVEDDHWGGEESCILLTDTFGPQALQGIEEFSHVEILFFFDRVDPARIIAGARHPRNNVEWPAVGIFAQRGKTRPNRIGSTICRVLRWEGLRLFVAELDAVDGTPVLDIKPVMAEFLPREPVRQPAWARELMTEYWNRRAPGEAGD